MWHGQTCYISQIKTKRVGAGPLWIFSMVAQIFNVFKFIFAKSSRRIIFFCLGHTITLGTFLRRSPLTQIHSWTSEISKRQFRCSFFRQIYRRIGQNHRSEGRFWYNRCRLCRARYSVHSWASWTHRTIQYNTWVWTLVFTEKNITCNHNGPDVHRSQQRSLGFRHIFSGFQLTTHLDNWTKEEIVIERTSGISSPEFAWSICLSTNFWCFVWCI